MHFKYQQMIKCLKSEDINTNTNTNTDTNDDNFVILNQIKHQKYVSWNTLF